MYIDASSIGPSPLGPEFSRIDVTVLAERSALSLHYWFDLPADLAPRNVPPSALVLLMLPLACHAHEHVRLEAPLDPLLIENLEGVQQIWCSWYRELRRVRIMAPVADPDPETARAVKTLASFSGGIDSFFTLLRHHGTITDLLSIAGFNTPADDFEHMRRHLGPVARKFGKRHVTVRTNVRYGSGAATPYSVNRWMNDLAHGCLLAAIAHLLESHAGTYLLPASHNYSHLIPYGSHPLTDPLFSSRALNVVHDGAAFSRIERTQTVVRSSEALSALHVCFATFGEGNCSRCPKCMRTMVTLDLLGARERALTFDWSGYSLERVASHRLPTENERRHFRRVGEHARAVGQYDLARAIDSAIVSSRRRARVNAALCAMKDPVIDIIKSNRLTRAAWNGMRALRARAI